MGFVVQLGFSSGVKHFSAQPGWLRLDYFQDLVRSPGTKKTELVVGQALFC